MSNITSMDLLEAIPVDRMVRVDGVDWTRTAKGLARDGVDLGLFHFEGRVLAGAVIDVNNLPVAAGEWWGGSTRTYYIYRVTDRTVFYSSFRNNTIYNLNGSSRRGTWDTSATLHRLTGAPAELESNGLAAAAARMGVIASELADANMTVDRLTRENAELRTNARTVARKPREVLAQINSIRHNLDQIAQLMEE